jgi:hypothetical protein
MKAVVVREFPDCDFCKENGVKRNAHYEGPTRFGPHASMCGYHHTAAGIEGSSITVKFRLEKQEPTGRLFQ